MFELLDSYYLVKKNQANKKRLKEKGVKYV